MATQIEPKYRNVAQLLGLIVVIAITVIAFIFFNSKSEALPNNQLTMNPGMKLLDTRDFNVKDTNLLLNIVHKAGFTCSKKLNSTKDMGGPAVTVFLTCPEGNYVMSVKKPTHDLYVKHVR